MLEAMAKAERRSLSNLIEYCLLGYLDQKEKRDRERLHLDSP